MHRPIQLPPGTVYVLPCTALSACYVASGIQAYISSHGFAGCAWRAIILINKHELHFAARSTTNTACCSSINKLTASMTAIPTVLSHTPLLLVPNLLRLFHRLARYYRCLLHHLCLRYDLLGVIHRYYLSRVRQKAQLLPREGIGCSLKS
jgi:hypothetical protein